MSLIELPWLIKWIFDVRYHDLYLSCLESFIQIFRAPSHGMFSVAIVCFMVSGFDRLVLVCIIKV